LNQLQSAIGIDGGDILAAVSETVASSTAHLYRFTLHLGACGPHCNVGWDRRLSSVSDI
jgi:hypothetical protein